MLKTTSSACTVSLTAGKHDKKNTDVGGLRLVSPASTSATCIPTIVRRYAETNYDRRKP